MFENAVKEFGERLGLSNFSLNNNGVASLSIDSSGLVSLEAVEQPDRSTSLLVTLGRELAPSETDAVEKLLKKINWRNNPRLVVHVGISANHLVLSSYLPERTVTAASIENTLRFLSSEMPNV